MIKKLASLIDLLAVTPTLAASLWMKLIRAFGVSRLPLNRGVFRKVGIFPLRDHYTEPSFTADHLKKNNRPDRQLPGIDWNLAGQQDMAAKFIYASELLQIQEHQGSPLAFSFKNDSFAAGDAEYLYNMIRFLKPRKIIEVGSGNSTLMAIEAIKKNKAENAAYVCGHVCVEPFEKPWLEKLDIQLQRTLVEDADIGMFETLSANDILFIDSSHMIRPGGDVLFEFLELLPILKQGVFVHVHDIFSPRDYPDVWFSRDMKLWNEQYLLEAFLSHNQSYKIVGALNYLKYHAPESLAAACPVFQSQTPHCEPGSFWIQKVL